MIDSASRSLFHKFAECSLPRSEWNHSAHLTACWVALDDHEPPAALAFLRRAISRYNEATGGRNTDTSGYHETLTAYFVGAVASLSARSIDEVLIADRCQRAAPLRHWSRDLLFSRQARASWVDPDLVPLAWDLQDRVSREPTELARPRHA